MSDTRTCVFLPAHNEALSVEKVIRSVRQCLPEADIVVINDGSSDDTARVAQAAGALVINLPFNLGIGGAIQTGLKYVYRNGYDVALEIDADGQHDPQYASQLIAALKDGDMVIGSRFIADTSYRASILRRFGIHLFSFLIQFVTGRRVYDSTSGYRAYNQSAISFLSRYYPADFPEPESIVMLLTYGFSIKEIPVTMARRTTGHSVVGKSDWSFKGAYFVASNAIAIILTGIRKKALP